MTKYSCCKKSGAKRVFGLALDRIDFDRIDYGRIDFIRIDFSIIDLCLDTVM